MNLTVDEIRSKVIPILRQNDISFAGVFGSYSRGQDAAGSDVDMLIKYSQPKSLFDFVGLEQDLSEKLNCKVDLVTENGLSKYIKDSVLNDLKIIYGKR